MRNYSLLFLIFLFFISCQKQPTEFEKLDSLFTLSTADTLKIAAISGKELNDSLITGKIIPPRFYHLFEFPIKFEDSRDSTKRRITAFKKILFGDGSRIAYLIGFNNEGTGIPNFTCLYVYDNNKGKMERPWMVEYAAGSEGSESLTESWIFDLNKDGNNDLITRQYECTLLGDEGAYSNFADTLTAGTLCDTVFKPLVPENYNTLKQKLKIDCICSCGSKN